MKRGSRWWSYRGLRKSSMATWVHLICPSVSHMDGRQVSVWGNTLHCPPASDGCKAVLSLQPTSRLLLMHPGIDSPVHSSSKIIKCPLHIRHFIKHFLSFLSPSISEERKEKLERSQKERAASWETSPTRSPHPSKRSLGELEGFSETLVV